MRYSVYCLSDKDGVFYIGITHQPLKMRLKLHLTEAKHYSSINKNKSERLLSCGSKLEIFEIDSIGGSKKTAMKLESYWIWQFKSWGFGLLNLAGIPKNLIRKAKEKKKSISIQMKIYDELIKWCNVECRRVNKVIEIAIKEKLERERKCYDKNKYSSKQVA